MQHHIALLGGVRFQVGQALPMGHIARTDDAAMRNSGRLIGSGCAGIAAFGTEEAVNPHILMLREPYIIYVRLRIAELRDTDGIFAEGEIVDAIERKSGVEGKRVYVSVD